MGFIRKKRQEEQRGNDDKPFIEQEGLVYVGELGKHVTRKEAEAYYRSLKGEVLEDNGDLTESS